MAFEDLLVKVGKFGRYQKCLTLLLCMPILFGTCQLFVQVFAAGKSNHWCQSWKNDDCQGVNLTENQCNYLKRELSIPFVINDENETVYEQCQKYNVTGLDFGTVLDITGGNTSLEKIPCDEGWIFDRGTFPSTIIIDFELVCGRSYLSNLAQSAYFAGFLVGSIVGGISSDIVGRRRTIVVSSLLLGVTGIATVFSPNMGMYIVMRFLVGMFSRALNITIYVLATELVSPSKRIVVGNVLFIFFAIGYILLAGCASLANTWRILQLVISLPFLLIFISLLIFVPDSPRWLIVKRRHLEAEKVLRKMAKVNGREAGHNLIEAANQINEVNQTEDMKGSFKDLMQSPICLFIALNMCFNWAVQSLVYYGLSLSTSTLGIDPYLSFVISGAIEVPAYTFCIFVPEMFGRKPITVLTMLISGISCCLTPVLPCVAIYVLIGLGGLAKALGIWRVLLSMVGKFCITISFSVVYTWAAELSPTPLRSSGMGLFSMSSRVGGILVPLLLLLEEIWPSLPVLVIGCLSITAGLLSLFLPETKGKLMPSRIEDTENFYRGLNNDKFEIAEKL